MPRYYCDYCDTYLTHDSPSVRKQHNAGYKHKANVREYYQSFEQQQTQILIDQKIKEHLGQTAAYQQVGAVYNQHLAAFPGMRTRLAVLPPPPMLPIGGIRPPMIPRPMVTSIPGYGAPPMMPEISTQMRRIFLMGVYLMGWYGAIQMSASITVPGELCAPGSSVAVTQAMYHHIPSTTTTVLPPGYNYGQIPDPIH